MADLFQYKHRYWWLVLILLLGFILRVYRLDHHGIWSDEKCAISTSVGIPCVMIEYSYFKFPGTDSTGLEYTEDDSLRIMKSKTTFSSKDFWHFNTISEVIKSSVYVNNSILYYLTLHFWINAFGISDFSTRFLSLIFGMLTIIVIYHIAKTLFNDFKIALLAGLLASLCPFLIFVSQEAKSHAMATFFATLATLFFVKIFFSGVKKYLYLLYGFTVTASLLSHVLTIHIFFGHALIMLLYCRKKETWMKYILTNVAAAVIYGFWLVNGGMNGMKFITQYYEYAAPLVENWKPGDNPFYMPADFINVLKGLVQILLPLFGNGVQNLGLRLGTLLPLLAIPALLIWIAFSKAKITEKLNLSILFVILLVHVVFITILAIIKGNIIIFLPIYGSMNSIPYAMVIMAFAIYQINGYSKNIRTGLYFLVAIQIGIMMLSWIPIYNDSRGGNPYVTLAQNIETSYAAGDTVVYPSWSDAQIANLYLKNRDDVLQKVDTTIKSKVLLEKHGSPQRTELINFQNGKLKY